MAAEGRLLNPWIYAGRTAIGIFSAAAIFGAVIGLIFQLAVAHQSEQQIAGKGIDLTAKGAWARARRRYVQFMLRIVPVYALAHVFFLKRRDGFDLDNMVIVFIIACAVYGVFAVIYMRSVKNRLRHVQESLHD